MFMGGGGGGTYMIYSLTTKPDLRYVILLLGHIHKWGWGGGDI